MIYSVDLVDEVVCLIDEAMQVRDVFRAIGKTEYHCDYPVMHYTYRSLLNPPGVCCLCGLRFGDAMKPCVSSGGYHAFVGLPADAPIEAGHRAEHRNLSLFQLVYDEFTFYIEADNLFPADQIRKPMVV